MYKTFKTRKTAVTFKPQRVVSAKGRTLPRVESGILKAKSVQELAVLQRDLRSMATKVKSDIGLMNRIG
jgi:hypothetical protein